MKVIFKFAIIILVNLLVNSCIQEQRVYPKQPIQGTTSNNSSTNSSNNTTNSNSNTSNSSNSTSTVSKINYLNYLNCSFSESVDSNSNLYFVSFRINLNFRTNFGSKIKYGIYAASSSSYSSNYTLIYQSPLLDNYKNDGISFSRKFNTDSIFSLSPLKNYLSSLDKSNINIYLVVQDSANNNYVYQSSSSSYIYYSGQPNYISINDQNFNGLENTASDLVYSVSLRQFQYPVNTNDINSNGIIQPPIKFKSFYYSSLKNKSVYFKIFYSTSPSSSNSYILYGTTTSYNLPTISSSSGFEIDILSPLVNLTSDGYYFKIELYDSKSNTLLRSDFLNTKNGSTVIYVETLAEDQRIYSLGYLKLIKNEDNDNDGFPSTYYLKIKLNSSDNLFPLNSTLYVNISNYAQNQYRTFVTRNNLPFSDTLSVLISGGTMTSKSYYDLGVNILFNDKSVINESGTENLELSEIKLESTTQD